ncbi:MAG: nuclear transport factor 2 family protein [Tissierellales bacterium]
MSLLEANKQVVRDFFSALGSFDLDGILKTVAENIVLTVPGTACLSGTYTLADLSGVAGLLGQACPDGITFTIKELTAEDNRVSCIVDGNGKLATGGNYTNSYHFLLKLRDGKIFETYEYMDTLKVESLFAPMLKAEKQE